jgi:hypothetical protein
MCIMCIGNHSLKRANELGKNNIHPTSVMSGYRLAFKVSSDYVMHNSMLATYINIVYLSYMMHAKRAVEEQHTPHQCYERVQARRKGR